MSCRVPDRAHRIVVIAIAALTACGRVGFDPSSDAGLGEAGLGDAATDSAGFIGASSTYIKASNPGPNDLFGIVAISFDGSTLAVAAFTEDSSATGIDGNQGDNGAPSSGAVYVFIRAGTAWTQQAYIKASNTGAMDQFGKGLALSADGNTLVITANLEDSDATGINGNQGNNNAPNSGAGYVFTRTGAIWSQQAYLKASNADAGDEFGYSAALSSDGDTLAISAFLEASMATGVDGNQAFNSAMESGAAYVFGRVGTTWTQRAYIKASNTEAFDLFGECLALSADGNTLAVAAPRESSGASGVGGNQVDNSVTESGAVYVYTRSAGTWSQQSYVKASNPGMIDQFGWSLAISGSGDTLAIGARFESSAATGVGGNQADDSAGGSGAVYTFVRNGAIWTQQAYVKAFNTGAGDQFGDGVALSGDGSTLVVAAMDEDSAARGIGGDGSDESASNSGAVYVYARAGGTWIPRAYVKASNTESGDGLAFTAVSFDGSRIAVGAGGEDSGASGIDGDQGDNSVPQSGAVFVLE